MAEHHPEAVLKFLKSWRTVLDRQAEAMNQGNIEVLDNLTKQSSKIQQQLKRILSSSNQLIHDQEIADLIRDLHRQQGAVIDSLKSQTEELAKEIGALRKNKTSLNGYKQNKILPPRFMSERT